MTDTDRIDLKNTCVGLNSGDLVTRFGPGEIFVPLGLEPDQRSMFHAILSLSRNVLFLALTDFVSTGHPNNEG
jgi:hypothetical protein